MATDPKIVSAELAAAKAAIKAFIGQKVPSWARAWITENEITDFAAAIVDAVDAARETATKEPSA